MNIPSLRIRLERSIDLYAILTLLLLMLFLHDSVYIHIPIVILACMGLIFPSLRIHRYFWFVVALFVVIGNILAWYRIDNHKYLIAYWCIGFFFALNTEDPELTLANSARLLIGLVFLFATVWKILSHDFLSGEFFHYTLLVDDRFLRVAQYFGGMTVDMANFNQTARMALINYDSTLQAVQLHSTPQLMKVANSLAWWTFGLEALIALAFLWPEDKGWSRWRDIPLLLFAVTTYSVARVIGFGWIIAIMGLVQSHRKPVFIGLCYVGSMLLLQFYRLPWSTILENRFL